jgi:hypothetical protein
MARSSTARASQFSKVLGSLRELGARYGWHFYTRRCFLHTVGVQDCEEAATTV